MPKDIEVHSSVKDETLIAMRREQIIKGAVKLFKEKGFHKATTREIAKAAGFSIGTLYEYIRTKEDVLYLVCDRIFNEVTLKLSPYQNEEGTLDTLRRAIYEYYTLIHRMHIEFTIMYQETKSLPKNTRAYILDREYEMVSMFAELLRSCVASGELSLKEQYIFIAANQIVVQGQAWAFRNWAYKKDYKIEQFIEAQTELFLHGLKGFS